MRGVAAIQSDLDSEASSVYGASAGISQRNGKRWHLPESQVERRIGKVQREAILRRHPQLAAVWEADRAWREAEQVRLAAIREANEAGVSLRAIEQFGGDDGSRLGESKSTLHRMLSKTPCFDLDEIPF